MFEWAYSILEGSKLIRGYLVGFQDKRIKCMGEEMEKDAIRRAKWGVKLGDMVENRDG